MKSGNNPSDLDSTDLQILSALQIHCKTSLAKLGEQVGLSASSVIERIKKLEDSGVITGYHASVNARGLGKDVTAFIGVSINHPKGIEEFEQAVEALDDVLECHHVTGTHTLLLKVKTANTSSLEQLISAIRSVDGVARTETMVVLSTHIERQLITASLEQVHEEGGHPRRPRINGVRNGIYSGRHP